MKTLTISSILCLCCLLLFAFSGPQPQQNVETTKVVKIKGFKLKPAAFKKFKQQKERYSSLKVDRNGVVRPSAGFKMIADKTLKEITILPETANYQTNVVTGIEAIDFGIFVVWCHCGGGLGDDCKFDMKMDNGYRVMTCEGGCGCGVAVTVGRTPPWGQIVDDIYL